MDAECHVVMSPVLALRLSCGSAAVALNKQGGPSTNCAFHIRLSLCFAMMPLMMALTLAAAVGAWASCASSAAARPALCARRDDLHPPAPATVWTSDNEDDVEGPPTPPPMVLNTFGYDGPTLSPWSEMEFVFNRLWDDGREVTIYMMIHYLEGMVDDDPEDQITRMALTMARRFGAGVTRIAPPDWWRTWLEDVLGRWRLGVRQARLLRQTAGRGDEVVLMQRARPQRASRPELWRRYMEQMGDYPLLYVPWSSEGSLDGPEPGSTPRGLPWWPMTECYETWPLIVSLSSRAAQTKTEKLATKWWK